MGGVAWLWVMGNPTVALVTVQASRSKAAFEALVQHWAGMLASDGDGVCGQGVHVRQTCLAQLIRRARGVSERKEPALAGCGRRGLAAWPRVVPWAHTPPTAGEVQTW
jgi:transposase